jgi:hypothetical protein
MANGKDNNCDRLFHPWDRDKLIVLSFAIFITNILKIVCLLNLFGLIFKRKSSIKSQKFGDVEICTEKIWVEIWVLVLLIAEIVALGKAKPTGFNIWCAIAIYGLIDIVGIIMDELLQPTSKGYVSIKDRSRWLIFTGINIGQVIICFAVLIKSYGDLFNPIIIDWVTALYQSILTITTLGYGEYVPTCNNSKFIVILELTFFLFMIGIKLPMAVSVLKVKIIENKSEG